MASNKTIQYLLQQNYFSYRKNHSLPYRVTRSVEAQIQCRTRERGVSHYRCPHDGEEKEVFHSCRNRGCTVCGKKRKALWVESQNKRLLNCGHYHLVFTLPREYRILWQYNRNWFIKAQFDVSAEVVKHLLEGNTYKGKKHEGRLGARVGIISTLHTWGRSLNLHPHIHLLVTEGGLDQSGEWVTDKSDYLLPIKQVKSLYRGKFQARIKAFLETDEVRFPESMTKTDWNSIHKALYRKEWSVNIQDKYPHGKGIMLYLSRYLGSSPLRPEQIKLINHDKEILFTYRSHLDKKQHSLRLTVDEFLKRYFVHQAEPRVHTVRYYGLYASQSQKKREQCVTLLGESKESALAKLTSELQKAHEIICSCCGKAMQLVYVSYRQLKNPYNKEPSKKLPFFGSLPSGYEAIRSG